MSVERIHRFMMAAVIGSGAGLIHYGNPNGIYILFFVVFMLVVYGVTDFCPSVWMMKKLGIKPEIQIRTDRYQQK